VLAAECGVIMQRFFQRRRLENKAESKQPAGGLGSMWGALRRRLASLSPHS
jgi:hypothetical protein